MLLLRVIYVLLQLVTIASPSGRYSLRQAYYGKKARTQRSNKRPCKLFEISQTRKSFGCSIRCTNLMGCYNYEHFPHSGLCILCVNEESIILEQEQFDGLVPYNSTIPAGGTFLEKNDQDDCFLGQPCYNGGTCVDGFHSFTCTCTHGFTGARCETADNRKFLDCAELYKSGQRSNGVYSVHLQDASTNGTKQGIALYCDMTTSGGGWTVFQRRYDGSVPFNNTWEEYKNGFGSPHGEHWLGNEYIHMMTKSLDTKYRLRIGLTSFGGNTSYAEYTNFKVASETDMYRITFGTYTGTAGDSLSYHNNRFFSTRDRDNDQHSYTCSQSSGNGGFWYYACHDTNLNGVYRNNPQRAYDGMVWSKWIYNQVMQATSMKFRPVNFP